MPRREQEKIMHFEVTTEHAADLIDAVGITATTDAGNFVVPTLADGRMLVQGMCGGAVVTG